MSGTTAGATGAIRQHTKTSVNSRGGAPGYTRFDPKTGEWIAENTGIRPDVEVDARPDLVAQGRDPQLEAAVAHLLEQLKKNPPTVSPPKLPPPAGARR